MSENVTLPSARIPLVDDKGLITREWLQVIQGIYQRGGGYQGFSNSELYGDAVTLQSYDELLERISSLEATNRDLSRAVQMLATSAWDQLTSTPPAAIAPDTFARINVLGDSDLAVSSGKARVGGGIGGSTAKFQVNGDADVSGAVRMRAALQVDGTLAATGAASSSASMTAPEFRVGANKVVGARAAGVSAYAGYAGQTMGATYSQAQVQATDTATKDASAKLAQVVTAMRTHGLIGD